MTAVLTMSRVTRRFGGRVALLDVSLRLEPGIIGVVGPNGAGKTTLLRLAAGLLIPNSGQIRWLDDRPRRHATLDNAVALATDGDALPARETATELLTMLMMCSGMTANDAFEHAEKTLLRFGLQEHMERPLAELSRGQRQRVKLAQAFALPSRLLLLDEPLNALDPVWRVRVGEMMREAVAMGTCVVMSSHILEEVESLASNLVLLFRGRVVAVGTQSQIRDRVENRGTALRIACDKPQKLAAALLERALVVTLRIEERELLIESSDLAALSVALPAAVLSSGVEVERVGTDGDDLTSLFQTLSEGVR